MKRIIALVAFVFVLTLIGLLSFAPDLLTIIFVILMAAAVAVGFFLGMVPAIQFAAGFRDAKSRVQKIGEVQSSAAWLSVQQLGALFHQKTMDALFDQYMEKALKQETEDQLRSDIEEIINEDSLALRGWHGLTQQIPGTLTALGLLGTFLGLIIGISTVRFSSVDAAISSIELLIAGIRTAFYTSIAGVVLSILFNLIYKTLWTVMLREMGLFMETFHATVFPTLEERSRAQNTDQLSEIVDLLSHMPKEREYFAGSARSASSIADMTSEQRMMPNIIKGLSSGEFIFVIQPRYDLSSRKIVGGEALMRWDNKELGMIYPVAFMGIVERNGYIIRIDKYIWEEVCKTIRRWMDRGIRPVPISVNISKTDILVMDVAEYFGELIQKYDISPRYLELEIAENAYLECEENVRELEQKLRQSGFRIIVNAIDEEFLAMSIMKWTAADAFKFDMRYMGSLSEKRESAMETMLSQAKKLHIPIIAKCIESAEQLSDLRRSGCKEGQGNYLKKPISVEEFEHITE